MRDPAAARRDSSRPASRSACGAWAVPGPRAPAADGTPSSAILPLAMSDKYNPAPALADCSFESTGNRWMNTKLSFAPVSQTPTDLLAVVLDADRTLHEIDDPALARHVARAAEAF